MRAWLASLLRWRPTLTGYVAGVVTVLLVIQLAEMFR